MTSPRYGCSDGLTLAGSMADRRAPRRTQVPRLVQVAHDGDAAYARCRDFSDVGMKLDLTAPLELNDTVTVALSPTIMLCGSVAWVRGRECGVAFDGPVDSAALLDAVEPPEAVIPSPATLNLLSGRNWAGRRAPTPSQQPKPNAGFQAGLAVTVMTGPNEERRGTVRWTSGNIAALELTLGEDRRAVPLLAGPMD